MALRDLRTSVRLPMPVWDASIRLFHWAMVLGVIGGFTTGWQGPAAVHRVLGEALLALLIFRLAWGLIGSDTARFTAMLHGPAAMKDALARLGERAPDNRVGHGPIGGWLAFAMLVLLAVLVGSGLAPGLDPRVHFWSGWLLLAAIAAHLLLIGMAMRQGHDPIRPMITGKKRLPAATRAPGMMHPLLALVILIAAAALVWATLGR